MNIIFFIFSKVYLGERDKKRYGFFNELLMSFSYENVLRGLWILTTEKLIFNFDEKLQIQYQNMGCGLCNLSEVSEIYTFNIM